MEHIYENIVGWCDFYDIYKLAVERAQDGDTFIEIGTANGKSAAFMCVEIVNSGKKIEFHTVDIFPAENGNQEKNVREILSQFDFCHVHKSDSVKFLREFEGSARLVFLDGAHDYKTVMEELSLAWHISSSLIAGHDYTNASYPEEAEAVHAFSRITGIDYKIIGTSFFFDIFLSRL